MRADCVVHPLLLKFSMDPHLGDSCKSGDSVGGVCTVDMRR